MLYLVEVEYIHVYIYVYGKLCSFLIVPIKFSLFYK